MGPVLDWLHPCSSPASPQGLGWHQEGRGGRPAGPCPALLHRRASPLQEVPDELPELGDPQVDAQVHQVLDLGCEHAPTELRVPPPNALLEVIAQDGFGAQRLPGLHGRVLDGGGVHRVAAVDADAAHALVGAPQGGHLAGHALAPKGLHLAPEAGVEVAVEAGVQHVPGRGAPVQLAREARHCRGAAGIELEVEHVLQLPAQQVLEQHQRLVEILLQEHEVEAALHLQDVLLHLRAAGVQVAVVAQVEEEQVAEVVGVVAVGVVVAVWVLQELGQLVAAREFPREGHHGAEVVEGGLEEAGRVAEHSDEGGVGRHQAPDLVVVEAHVVADDVEAGPGPVVLHQAACEKGRVVEVVAAVGEGELEPVLLAEAEQDVEQRAAGRLVRLHEHDVAPRLAASRRAVGRGWCLWLTQGRGAGCCALGGPAGYGVVAEPQDLAPRAPLSQV